MKIKTSPVRMDEYLMAAVEGDTVNLNGITLDFGQLPDGSYLPASAIDCKWIVGDVHRIEGDIHLTLLLPHGHFAPLETRFPEFFDKYMTVVDGIIPLPPHGGDK